MKMALHGRGAPPDWYWPLVMAEAWGAPPWQVEAEASAVWADRFALLNNARAERDNPKKLSGAGTGTTSRRLI